MAKCIRCGRSAGFFSKYCDECIDKMQEEKRNSELREGIANKRKKSDYHFVDTRKEYNEKISEIKKRIVNDIYEKIDKNGNVIFYKNYFVNIDFSIEEVCTGEKFDCNFLVNMGLDGWEISATFPKTKGYVFKNKSFGSTVGETWGAGLGGIVEGMYVVLKKNIKSRSEIDDNFLEKYVDDNLDTLTSSEEKIELQRLWSFNSNKYAE